jgi:hypothetical protein
VVGEVMTTAMKMMATLPPALMIGAAVFFSFLLVPALGDLEYYDRILCRLFFAGCAIAAILGTFGIVWVWAK